MTAQRFPIADRMANQANAAVKDALTALSSETSTDVQLLQDKYGALGKLLSEAGLTEPIKRRAGHHLPLHHEPQTIAQLTTLRRSTSSTAIGTWRNALARSICLGKLHKHQMSSCEISASRRHVNAPHCFVSTRSS